MTEFHQLIKEAAGHPPRPVSMAQVRSRAARLTTLSRARLWLLALVGLAGAGVPLGTALSPAGDSGRVETGGERQVGTVDGKEQHDSRTNEPSLPNTIAAVPRLARGAGGPAAATTDARGPAIEDVSVAFASDRSGSWQIHVADSGLRSSRAVTSGGGDKRLPALSPDGRWVAYVAGSTTNASDSRVEIVGTDGTGPRTLSLDGTVSDPSWSPDGRTLAVARRVPAESPTARGSNWDIWTVNIDGSDARRIAASDVVEFQPAWSPDGRRIAYVHFGTSGTASLWIVDADGGNPVRVSPDGTHALHPTWAPDGDRLAFAGIEDDDGTSRLFTVGADGSGLRRLTSTTAWDYRPTWTTDGDALLFERDPDGSRVWGCLVGGGVNVGPGGQVDERSGVVQNCIPGATGPQPGHLWIVGADGANARPLTSGPANHLEPTTRRTKP